MLCLVDSGLLVYFVLLVGVLGVVLLVWVMLFYVLWLKDGEFVIGIWVVVEVICIFVMLDLLI